MTDADLVKRHRGLYGRFLERQPDGSAVPDTAGATLLEVAERTPVDEVKARLSAVFEKDPAVLRIALTVAGNSIGVVTPRSLAGSAGTSGPGISDGDGLSFPLETAEYRLIKLKCAKPGCVHRATAAYYDVRDNPECPDHKTPMTAVDRT